MGAAGDKLTIDNEQLTIMSSLVGAISNSFPKETPSLSTVNCPLSIYLLNLKFSETLPDVRAESTYKTAPAVGE